MLHDFHNESNMAFHLRYRLLPMKAPFIIDRYQVSIVMDCEAQITHVGLPGWVDSAGNPGFSASFQPGSVDSSAWSSGI